MPAFFILANPIIRMRFNSPLPLMMSVFCGLLVSLSAAAAPVPEAPKFESRSFLLMDFHSGQILAEKEPDLELEPASITKVMTSYIVFDELKKGNISLDDMVPISEKAWKLQGSRMFIEVGDKVLSDRGEIKPVINTWERSYSGEIIKLKVEGKVTEIRGIIGPRLHLWIFEVP